MIQTYNIYIYIIIKQGKKYRALYSAINDSIKVTYTS